MFIDEYGIAEAANLRHTLHELAKKGAVIRPDWTQGVNMLQVHGTPVLDPQIGRYRFWAYEWPDELWRQGILVAGYYESEDGLHWWKPVLDQVEYRGSRRNHYALDGSGYYVYDPLDPDPACGYEGVLQDQFRVLLAIAEHRGLVARFDPAWWPAFAPEALDGRMRDLEKR